MKKLLVSTIAAAAIATTASADMKIGVGIDLMTNIANPTAATVDEGLADFASAIGSTPMIRVDIDGLVDGLRVEPRLAYISASNPNNKGAGTKMDTAALTGFGIAAYYDLSKVISVGASYDILSVTFSDSGTTGADGSAKGSLMGVMLKGEVELGKGFTVASELGFVSSSTTTTSGTTTYKAITGLAPHTSVTLRYFF